MPLPHRAIHLDFHTMPAIPDVGADFDPDDFAGTLADARVDFITVCAKCNLGMAYYPTKVGVMHPSLRRDLLGEMIESCHRRDIAVATYFNAGLDHEMAQRHRDWVVLDRDGRVYQPDRLNPFFRIMCFATPWADHLAAMIEEVLAGYPVDGIFLDCWAYGTACYGNECLSGLREQGLDVFDQAALVDAQDQRKMDFARGIRRMIDQKRPGNTYFLNGIPMQAQAGLATHLDLESLPAGGWGYGDFPWKVRVARKLSDHVVRLTGRFHRSWGDFGGLRTQAGLDFDCFQAISHAAVCGIGDHLHPRGRLYQPVYDRIGSIYRRVEALEPWTRGAAAVTDLAVVMPGLNRVAVDPGPDPDLITGVTRALDELRQQFDLIDVDGDWSGYRAVVLVDPVRLDESGLRKLREHLEAGGTVLATGAGGLLADHREFPPEWGLDYLGCETFIPAFLSARESLDADLPEMPLAFDRFELQLRPRDGTEVLADVVEPYFSRHWDGFHGHVYTPPNRKTQWPAITRCGPVIHLAYRVFGEYGRRANPAHRAIVAAVLKRLLPDPLILAPDLPSFARATVTAQDDRTMVHLLSYVPELRGSDMEIVEEPIVLRNATVRVRRDAPQKVYLAPEQQQIAWSAADGRVEFTVPEVRGYRMVVLE